MEEIMAQKKDNKKIRRVCLFGGPGSGKSKLAGYLNYMLMDYNCDFVGEYIKGWAYSGKIPRSLDQWYVYGKQSHAEDDLLRDSLVTKEPGVDFIITDSPLYLQCCYSQYFKVPGTEQTIAKTHIFEKLYPSFNIFLERPPVYRTNGRYQDLAEAKKIDKYILRNLDKWGVSYVKVPVTDVKKIEELIREALGDPKDRK
jgi:hypothetical protein